MTVASNHLSGAGILSGFKISGNFTNPSFYLMGEAA